jgi:hypothetical protein
MLRLRVEPDRKPGGPAEEPELDSGTWDRPTGADGPWDQTTSTRDGVTDGT